MEIFKLSFINVIDVILVAFIAYQIFKLIRGTSAFSIFMGISALYLLWIIVRTLNMELLTMILGQVIGIGLVALVVVFQQEIRRFLLYVGNRYFKSFGSTMFSRSLTSTADSSYIDGIVTACENMSKSYTGALIVFARRNNLTILQETGDTLDAKISSRLIETIFFKNCPLHDGAMIVQNQRIASARCVLPTTESDVPAHLGMRHRAAIGASEQSDVVVVVVSEQTGTLSFVEDGKIYRELSPVQLKERLAKAMDYQK